MSEIQEVLANNIKKYRKQLDLTQTQLSEKCQLSTNFIGLIETQKKFPSPTTIEKIAAGLGIKSYQLFSIDYTRDTAKEIVSEIEGSIDSLSELLKTLKS